MAELFDKDRVTITRHISNIFKEEELIKEAVCSKFEHTAEDGKKYTVQYYNLDVVISVGYRVKSKRGTQFRQWSTKVIKQNMIKGDALHDIMELKADISFMKNILMQLVDRPINISINNQIGSPKLEDKLIDLIDEVISSIKSDTVKHQLEDVKQDIQSSPTSSSAKQRVSNFFKEIGDTNSTTHKAIKGAGIAKGIISEIIKLGSKLKDLV